MIGSIKHKLFSNIKNIPGWKTNRKIVVIECDDWGSIRMPSAKVFDKLVNQGVNVDTSRFNRYDTLANKEDLELLFSVLQSVSDKNGNSAIMTAIANVANPDFEKIAASGFKKYYYEPFTDTLKKYYPAEDVFSIWEKGIAEHVFVPQLHGREHVSVQLWLKKLQAGDKSLLEAFKNGFVSLDVKGIPSSASEFRPEFFFEHENQKAFLINSIQDGIKLFEKIFGYEPKVFVPSNGIFHPEFDRVLSKSGIKYMFTTRSMPYPDGTGGVKNRTFIPGQSGPLGLRYYTRNCAFEPADPGYMGIKHTLEQISASFRWGKPANISTHRANFVGSINRHNRETGLYELRKLLKEIIKKWPDVEFFDSADAFRLMVK